MLIIKKLKKENLTDKYYIEKMLKRYKNKVRQVKQLEKMRDKQCYDKPSVIKRHKKQKTILTIKYREDNNFNNLK